MPDLRRQISYPRDLGDTASSRGGGGGAGKGEAWMRIRRRLRAELGEEVFSSWFGCLELDALSDLDVYLSVPTKFLKSWIQSHYVDRILPALASEFPAIKRVSINVRSSARAATACATENPAWIPFEPSATQFLHQQLPELEFLSGAIGYFRTRQTTEEPRFGAEASLAATAELTATVLSRYTGNSGALFDDEPRAAAKSLMGVMLARLADKGQKEKWEQASNRFAEAVSIMPENTEPRNLLALSKVALCCVVRDGFDARPAISALKDVLSLRPNDLQALANLEGVYAHLENSPAAAAATEVADLPYLRKQAHAVYLVADP